MDIHPALIITTFSEIWISLKTRYKTILDLAFASIFLFLLKNFLKESQFTNFDQKL